jgi:prepilin-type processing-associated H-X9-DG protein
MQKNATSRYSAFSLVELMTVLAITLLLAAILFGVFARGRERGRSAVCQSNLKQIALGIQQYVQDYDGYFPSNVYYLDKDTPAARAVYWYDAAMPYIKTDLVLQCPTSGRRDPTSTDYAYNNSQLNYIVWSPDRNPKYNKSLGAHESRLLSSEILLNGHFVTEYGDNPGVYVDGALIQTSCGQGLVATLHSGGANGSYLDGHVKWLSQTQWGELQCGLSRIPL